MDFLSYFALALLFIVFITLAYGMIAIHDIPYNIAKARNHPHQDAIHYGGWISLFTLHAIWPFLWIWATAYHPEFGYAGIPRVDKELAHAKGVAQADPEEKIAKLEKRLGELEANSKKI
jgi:hypothetical protein